MPANVLTGRWTAIKKARLLYVDRCVQKSRRCRAEVGGANAIYQLLISELDLQGHYVARLSSSINCLLVIFVNLTYMLVNFLFDFIVENCNFNVKQ